MRLMIILHLFYNMLIMGEKPYISNCNTPLKYNFTPLDQKSNLSINSIMKFKCTNI